jgi:hypothetical protein
MKLFFMTLSAICFGIWAKSWWLGFGVLFGLSVIDNAVRDSANIVRQEIINSFDHYLGKRRGKKKDTPPE